MNHTSIAYDVFFSYHSQDREVVEPVARALQERGLRVFLDRWYLLPGRPWPQALEEALGSCRAVAVFLGRHGTGRWQQREKDLALDRQARDPRFPVIPVLLAQGDAALGFLGLNTWVDLSRQPDDPLAMEILASAVRGEPPGPDLQERIQAARAAICPYRGLRPFREEDAAFFFGRDAVTEELVRAVGRQAFRRPSLVALVGASGCGKSSVARAGLLPRLRREGRGQVWDVMTLVPGDRPMQALAAAMISLLESEMTETDRLREVAKLGRSLAEGEVALRDVVTKVLEKQPGTDRLLLLADQWEELYTLCPDESVRCRFTDQLLEAAEAGSLTVVLTLRGDFYGHALNYRPLADALKNAVVNLGPMTLEELKRVVVGPAEKVSLSFEPGLVERILNDVREEPGNLPLLEFVLTELWGKRQGDRLLHGAYESMGGVQGAIACRAEELYARLADQEQKMVRGVFLQLVKAVKGVEVTRRRVAMNQVPESAQPLVKSLADARLLVTGLDAATGAETVEVAHEALIRSWGRLRGWVDEDREFLLWSQRLNVAVEQWERSDHDAATLLRVAPLTEAEQWLGQRPHDLSASEKDFINESMAAREHERAARERTRRWVTMGSIAASLVFLGLAGIAGVQWRLAGNEARRAEEQARIAISNEKKAEEQRSVALSRQLAAQSLTRLDTHLDQALLLGVESWRASQTFEAKSSLLKALLRNPYPGIFFSGHKDGVRSVAFSPDGKTLASGSEDKTVILWDMASRQPLGDPLEGHENVVTEVAFSPDGKTLASGSMDNTIILWDVATRQPLGEPLRGQKEHEEYIWCIAFSPDGKTLASGSSSRIVVFWDIATRQPIGEPLRGHNGYLTSVTFSPDGKILASGSGDNSVMLWDVATRQPIGEALTGHKADVTSVIFSPDGKTLASGSGDRTVILWDVASRQPLGDPLKGHERDVSGVAFSPDGKTLASGSLDHTIILWDVETQGYKGRPMTGHRKGVSSIAFSSDGKTLASGSWDNTLITWDVSNCQSLGRLLEGNESRANSIAFSPDGKTLASGIWSQIDLWDVTTCRPMGEPLQDHRNSVWSVAFGPDGKTLASGSMENIIVLWDVKSRQPMGELVTGHKGWVNVTFSPDGKSLASASGDGSVILWDVSTRQPMGEPLQGDKGGIVSCVAFSPDGRTLAFGNGRGSVMLWDVTTRQAIGKVLTGNYGLTASIAFCPYGKLLAAEGKDNKIMLWDVTSLQPVGEPLHGHNAAVSSIDFSPDGKTLATADFDHTVRLWDVATRQPMGVPLTGFRSSYALELAFSPDGRTLASGSAGEGIILWDLDPESWRARACRMANRNLTPSEWRQFLGDEPYRKTCPVLPDARE